MKKIILAILVTLWAAPAALSQDQDEPCHAGLACIDQILTDAEKQGFAGTVMVAGGGKILFQKGYGKTEGTKGEAIDIDTVYLIGSIVKDFTRMTVFGLEADGKLSRSDTLETFFPNVPEDKKSITVQNLLDHKSGIPDLIDPDGNVQEQYTVGYDYIPITRDQMVEKTLKAPLLYEPGTQRRYSNSGFALLAAIIEVASGDPFEENVKAYVFEPAGMTHTGYRSPDWSTMTIAHGIVEGKDWGTPIDGDRWMADGPSWNLRGNGGMLGTVPDLYLFISSLLREGAYPDEIRDAMISDPDYSKTYGSRYFAGAGSNGIYNSVFVIMLDLDRIIIMITNNSEHNGERDYLKRLTPYAFDKAKD